MSRITMLSAVLLFSSAVFSVSADDNNNTNNAPSSSGQGLLDKIFNFQTYDDGCWDFPFCEIDVTETVLLSGQAQPINTLSIPMAEKDPKDSD